MKRRNGIVYNRTLLDFAPYASPESLPALRAKTRARWSGVPLHPPGLLPRRTFRNLDDLKHSARDWLATVATFAFTPTQRGCRSLRRGEVEAAGAAVVAVRIGLKWNAGLARRHGSVGGNLYSVPDATGGGWSRCTRCRRDPHLRGRCAHCHSSDARRARPRRSPRHRKLRVIAGIRHYRRCHADPRRPASASPPSLAVYAPSRRKGERA